MANHMSAREAWEIVKGGNPMHRRYPEEWEVMRYARACAIVEALVDAHESRCALDDDETGDRPTRLLLVEACLEALAHVRALERGEEGK